MPAAAKTVSKGGGERGVAVADEKAEPVHVLVEVHQQIPGRRHYGQPDGCMGGPGGQVHPAVLEFDDEQDVLAGSPLVWTVRKSHASTPAAWVRRNWVQLGPPRRGAGQRPC